MSNDAETTGAADEEIRAMRPTFHVVDVIGLAVGLVPFAVHLDKTTRDYSEKTSTGGLEIGTETIHHIDYAAVAGGGLAILLAIVSIALLGRMKNKAVRFAVFATVLGLGGLHVVRAVVTAGDGRSVSGTILR